MLGNDKDELDAGSQVLQGLLVQRQELKTRLDEFSSNIATTTSLSEQAVIDLAALHENYERIKGQIEQREKKANEDVQSESTRKLSGHDDNSGKGALAGGAIGITAAILSGGILAPLILLGPLAGAAAGAPELTDGEKEEIAALRKSLLSKIEADLGPVREGANKEIEENKRLQQALLDQLKTEEQKRLYFGIVAELLLDNGINIARQLQQYAQFNGISADAIFAMEDQELRTILERLTHGNPMATDIDRLIFISDQMSGSPAVTPEIRTLKQFINHVIIPNKTYFDIMASFSDDIRSQDISTFPPLEVLGQKPITLSGRLRHDPEGLSPEAAAKQVAEMADKAKAKVMIRQRIAGGTIYTILKNEDGLSHLEKLRQLDNANEEEIGEYADIFSKIETAMTQLVDRQSEQSLKESTTSQAISQGEKDNKLLDSKIAEITARNNAKKKGHLLGDGTRTALSFGGALVLDLMGGGGAATGTLMMSHAAKSSGNAASMAVGRLVGNSAESGELDDFITSLHAQKADVPALRNELAAVQTAIEETRKDQRFQAILKDEAKRSQVAETLLARSLIRNGLNNSLEIEETCQTAGVASVDDFLEHYKGTRLGLSLKKLCHGIADSNDISVILAESNCLGSTLSKHDQTLKMYVEEVMKPNIASYYSKASKMDVVSHHNLTGFGNELHFAAEMQMETARAVRVLLSNEFGMSVIGREDVRGMFDFWLHRHGDRRLYDEKIRDGEMSDEYPAKRVSFLPAEAMDRFVDMAKRSVSSGRTSFPKVGDMFMRICAYEYFLPQAIQTGGKDNIFTDHPQSPAAYPMVNQVVSQFTKNLSFADLGEYREKIGERLDNVIAQSFIDFFSKVGEIHRTDPKVDDIRGRVFAAANYDDYAPVFDRYTKNITRDALDRFDLFLDIYRENLEKQFECSTVEDRQALEEQIARVKDLADGKLNPDIIRPGTHEARLRAHDESHLGENVTKRG